MSLVAPEKPLSVCNTALPSGVLWSGGTAKPVPNKPVVLSAVEKIKGMAVPREADTVFPSVFLRLFLCG